MRGDDRGRKRENGRWATLRNRRFVIWLAGQGVSNTGSALTVALAPIIAVVVLHAPAKEVGLIVATSLGCTAVARPAAAVFAERSRNRIRALFVINIVSAIVIGLIPVFWVYGSLSLPVFWIVIAVDGLAGGVFGAYSAPMVADLVDKESLPQASGLMGSAANVAGVAGPTLGGVILAIVSAPLALVADSASFLVGALSCHLIRGTRASHSAPKRPTDSAPQASKIPLMRAFGAPFRVSGGAALLGILLALTVVNGLALSELTVLMIRGAGVPPVVVAVIAGLGAVGGVLAGVSVEWIAPRVGSYRGALIGAALASLATMALAVVKPGGFAVIPYAAYEVIGAGGSTLLISLAFAQVIGGLAPAARARGIAVAAMLPEAGQTIGALIGGILVGVLGLARFYDMAAALGLVVAVLSVWLARRKPFECDGMANAM
ncbi:MAG: MFS transporter [Ferrimicrobium acidiphilum]